MAVPQRIKSRGGENDISGAEVPEVRANGKAALTRISTLYRRGEQKSVSERTPESNAEVERNLRVRTGGKRAGEGFSICK